MSILDIYLDGQNRRGVFMKETPVIIKKRGRMMINYLELIPKLIPTCDDIIVLAIDQWTVGFEII